MMPITPSAPAPLVTINATKTESSSKESASSTTEAPNMVIPSRFRNTLSSIRVWADMLTEVADNTRPRKIDSFHPYSRPAATAMVSTMGATELNTPASSAGFPVLTMSSRCHLFPRRT